MPGIILFGNKLLLNSLNDATATAAYSLRKLNSKYMGSAVRVRRSSDNAEQDIGFSDGGLDTNALTTFVNGTGLPLDNVSGASVAYGLRKLRSAYSGSAVRVRRTSDNAEQDIGFTASGDLDTTSLTSFVGTQNLLTYSEEFDNAAWVKVTVSVTANSTTAPDGTLTADSLTPSGSGAWDNRVYKTNTVSIGTSYVLSVWAKSSASNAKMTLGLENYGGQTFSISSSWQRYSVTVVSTGTSGNFNIYAGEVNPITGAFVSSNAVDVWGAQFNTGSSANTYNKTVAGIGGNGFVTTWYDQSESNLLTYSEEFDNGAWSKNDTTVTANQVTAPDGTLTGDLATFNGNGSCFLRNSVTVTALTQYTFSFYAKKGTATNLGYSVYNATSGGDIVASTSYYSQINSSTWTRVSVTFTTPSGCTSIFVYTERGLATTGTTAYFWGAQVNIGSSANAYVKTTATPVGNGGDAVQATANNQPRIVNAGAITTINNRIYVDFTGTDQYLTYTQIQPYTILAVNKLSSTVADGGGLCGTRGSDYGVRYNTTATSWAGGSGANDLWAGGGGSNIINNVATAVVAKDTLHQLTVYRGSTTNNINTIGSYYTGGSRPFSGQLSEMIMYPTRISTANYQTIAQNQSVYFAIANASADGYISKWYDQSTNGYDVVQATAGTQPRIVNAGVVDVDSNGKPVVRCMGDVVRTLISSVRIPNNTITGSYEISVNQVIQPNSIPNNYQSAVGTREDSGSWWSFITNPNNKIGFHSNLQHWSSSYLYTNKSIITDIVNSSDKLNEWLNGTKIQDNVTVSAFTSNVDARLYIGSGSSSAGSEYFRGDIQEVILFTKAISDADRSKIEKSQGKYYNVNLT